MKKNILVLLLSLLFFIAADAQAQEGCLTEDSCCVNETRFYAKILSGVNLLQNTALDENRTSYQPGYLIAGSLGYRLCGLSLEAEYAYRNNTIRKMHFFGEGFSHHGYLQDSSCMANILWNVPLSLWECGFWGFHPFLGAGIGYDFQQMHSSNSRIIFDQKWNHLSWQLMAGLAYPLWCNTEVTLEYKFHQGGCHFYNHSIGVGLLYNFDYIR